MKPQALLSRFVVSVIVLTMVVALGLVFRDGLNWLMSAQLLQSPAEEDILLTLDVSDDFSGLVGSTMTLSSDFLADLEQISDGLDDTSYPVIFSFCLRQLLPSDKELFCEEREFFDADEFFDLSDWQYLDHDLHLTVPDEDYQFQAEFSVSVEGFDEPQVWVSDPLDYHWKPRFDLRTPAGDPLGDGDPYPMGALLFVFSRSPDLIITRNGQSFVADEVTTTPSSEGDFHQWTLRPQPLDAEADEDLLCLEMLDQRQCHPLLTPDKEAAPEYVCGNGIREPGEQCDDENRSNGDGCDESCQFEQRTPSCGDGIWDQDEECDDGNLLSGDGCNEDCRREETVVPVSAGPLQYPDYKLYFHEISDQFVFLFASLEHQRTDSGQNYPRPEDLFIRLKTNVAGGVVPQESRRVDGYPVLQTILPKGTQVFLEFGHRTSDEAETIFAEQYVDTFAGETITKGAQTAPEYADEPHVQKILQDSSSLSADEIIPVARDIRLDLPSQRFTNESLTINGVADGSEVKICLVDLMTGAVRDGNTLSVRDNGTFYDRVTDEYLDSGEYAVLMYADRTEPCDELVQQYVQIDDKSRQPVILEVVDSALDISVLDVQWISNDEVSVNTEQGTLWDLNPDSAEASVQIDVNSSFQEDIQVTVSFVDDLIRQEQVLDGYSRDQLYLDLSALDYGAHRVRVYAILPNGQKTADILYDFDYQPLRQSAPQSSASLQQWLSLLLLLALGVLYVVARLSRSPHQPLKE